MTLGVEWGKFLGTNALAYLASMSLMNKKFFFNFCARSTMITRVNQNFVLSMARQHQCYKMILGKSIMNLLEWNSPF
jgi:hypothetical protein